MNLLQYSNGWGHLVMSVVSMAAALMLILLSSDPTSHYTGFTLITVVVTYWFASSGINSLAHQIVQPSTATAPALAPPTETKV